MLRLKRWFYAWLEVLIDRASYWQSNHDLCEICHVGTADRVCIGCERRIDYECESGYCSDVDLCSICRAEITPEQEAEALREAADRIAEEGAR
jgi:hypothetical protein